MAVHQEQSLLLRLPRELRDEVFRYVFANTGFTHGQPNRCHVKCMRTSPHPLALLYSCRQIYAETKNSWMSEVVFTFTDIPAFLEKLSPLPPEILCKIRHIRLPDEQTKYSIIRKGVHIRKVTVPGIFLNESLGLVPDLRLDTLTVFGRGNAVQAHESISWLIRNGSQWKRLEYMLPSCLVLSILHILKPPTHHSWVDMLYQRDGTDKGASLTIHKSTASEPGHSMDMECFESYPGVQIDHIAREVYEEYQSSTRVPSEHLLNTKMTVEIRRSGCADITPKNEVEPWTLSLMKADHWTKMEFKAGIYELSSTSRVPWCLEKNTNEKRSLGEIDWCFPTLVTCKSCRVRMIACHGGLDSCDNCRKLSIECVYIPTPERLKQRSKYGLGLGDLRDFHSIYDTPL
ncbi:hypothetical protein BS50DRAFT_572800 [Corynespora cassiicola Philippines]|uniref:Zn(2)-C6 fungal-type domain-containing protein n=1 Tax=Corynespora cassiicola Philippines TaxID=1448308 RepID=A0A2T2NR89_CORCC|nr:hypothetical protein BS50DRAFT_572800 [Corynespora cassiicola Philippines]